MVKLVGIGPGSPEYMTARAKEIIETADDIIAFKRVKETLHDIRSDIRVISSIVSIGHEIGENTVILASGDPCFYGSLNILQRMGLEIEEVVTGISSLQYLMARLKKSYESISTLSFHGRKMDMDVFKAGEKYFILTDGINTPATISKKLFDSGFRGKIIVGEDLSYPDEKIYEVKIGEDIMSTDLSVVVVELEVD